MLYYWYFRARGKKSKKEPSGKKQKYQCDQCPKAFHRSHALLNHVRVHTGEKPFSCSVCSKAFAQSSYLKDHFRMHTGEKPFSCPQCTQSFALSSNLRKHLEQHAEGLVRVPKFIKLNLQKMPLTQRDCSNIPVATVNAADVLAK